MANQNTIFYNADYLVMEYMDMIKQPMYQLLYTIRDMVSKETIDSKFTLAEILKLNLLQGLSDEELANFYIEREHQNIFQDIIKEEVLQSEGFDVEELLKDQITSSYRFISDTFFLPATSALEYVKKNHLVNDVIVYYPYDATWAKEDLEARIRTRVTFMDDFEKIVELAGSNSTYFLSDWTKLNILREKKKLKYSSITLPVEYNYNAHTIDDILEDEKNIFKVSFMRACSYPHPEDTNTNARGDQNGDTISSNG